MEQFYAVLWSAVGIIITGIAGWLVAVITSFFNSKIKDKKLAKMASDITTIIVNAVSSVFQTFVDTLKKNGKFDEKAQIEAKEKALTIINSQLTEELKQYIQDNFGDIQEYLMNRIEAVIYSLKK